MDGVKNSVIGGSSRVAMRCSTACSFLGCCYFFLRSFIIESLCCSAFPIHSYQLLVHQVGVTFSQIWPVSTVLCVGVPNQPNQAIAYCVMLSSVGSKTLNLLQACLLSTVFEFIGALALGSSVTDTMAGSILRLSAFHGYQGETNNTVNMHPVLTNFTLKLKKPTLTVTCPVQ